MVFFSAAFPVAPAIAMVNNLIEVRTDAGKFTKSYRRPVPNRVAGIGAWFEILKTITIIGIVVNVRIFTYLFLLTFHRISRHLDLVRAI